MRLLALAITALVLSGCPKKPEPAKRSSVAMGCSSDADCNHTDGGVASCGMLRQCVDSMCSSTASLPIPCQ